MAERARRRDETAALRIRGLHVYYGLSHALQGVDLDPRLGGSSPWSGATAWARRRCATPIMGLRAGRRAARSSFEPARSWPGCRPSRVAQPRRRVRAAGAAAVGVAHGGRAPAALRARRPRRMDAGADLRRVPPSGGAAREPGRPALGRRAADARDLARHAPQPAPAGDGRADRGACARDRAAGRGHADPDRRERGDLGPRDRAEHRGGHCGVGRRRDHGQRPHPPDHGRGGARRRP